MNNNGYIILDCPRLNFQFVEQINLNEYRNKTLVIQVKGTKFIDKDVLLYLKKIFNSSIKISVIGPYRDEKAANEEKRQRYFLNTLYDLDELYNIIVQFERIEENIDPKWDEFDKVIYLVETIVRNIMYDPEYLLMKNKGIDIPKAVGLQDMADYYDRSLRGMLTRKSICAGYAVIFKELANRNGIACKYVNGVVYDKDGKPRGGHAWNLVKIDGRIYPLDITWKNTKYRKGDFSNIEDISCDIRKFKKAHRPYDENDNYGLTQMPKKIVEKAKKKTTIRTHYNSTTYVMSRSDGTRFVVSQIGIYKGLYRYLYSEIKNDGSYSIPAIVFSETNLVSELNEYKFERSNHYNEFINSFANVLFSEQNLYDSKIEKGTKYIGCCELPNQEGYVKNFREIIKPEKAIRLFKLRNIKSKERKDGSIVTVVQFPNKTNNGLLYEYYIYVLSKGPKGPMVMEYNIYSNSNYFEMSSSFVADSILSDSNLMKSVSNGGIMR